LQNNLTINLIVYRSPASLPDLPDSLDRPFQSGEQPLDGHMPFLVMQDELRPKFC
jgi:hypothetical protein